LTTVPSTSLLAFDWEPTYVSLISALAERPLTQEDCMVCCAEGHGRSARHQPKRPGVASDGEGRHSGVKGAVRPAQN